MAHDAARHRAPRVFPVLVDYATLTLYLLTFLVLLFKRISAYCRARERKTFSG